MRLSYRDVKEEDIPFICELPENKEVLFYMFPKADYPLSEDQLKKVHQTRFEPTVFLEDEKIVGYANLYQYEDETAPYVGHVILDREKRGKGYGRFIVKTMIEKAMEKFNTNIVKLAVFRDNIPVYNLYRHLGFKMYKIAVRKDTKGADRFLIFMEYKG